MCDEIRNAELLLITYHLSLVTAWWSPRLVSRQRLLLFREALICLSYSGDTKLLRKRTGSESELDVTKLHPKKWKHALWILTAILYSSALCKWRNCFKRYLVLCLKNEDFNTQAKIDGFEIPAWDSNTCFIFIRGDPEKNTSRIGHFHSTTCLELNGVRFAYVLAPNTQEST